MEWIRKNIDLILIIALGFILRFSISITHSYSNDELSAIHRLRYDNFSDLIEFGVMKGDMHPAGVQVFMKIWSSIAGTSELWMRLPFVLCGVVSIFMVYLLGLKWFNSRKTGIVAAALLAVLYFPVMHSEYARPYSPGLLIILLIAWLYHKVLFSEVKNYSNAIFLGVAFAAAMYTHYFAFMFAGFIGLTGMFFLNNSNFKYYIVSGLTAILLFLPHYTVTDYHLNVGGLQWLKPPDKDWLFDFLFYALNESWLLIGGLAVLVLVSFLSKNNFPDFNRKYFYLCLIWFFGIYLIGHIYSLVETPVLKEPVMLFALPFLLLLIGLMLSRINFFKPTLVLIIVGGSLSTIVEKDLYGNKHFGLFEEIAREIVVWQDNYGDENIYTVYNLSNPAYMDFYADQWGASIRFDWDVIEFADDMAIREDLMNRKESYCIVGYSARLTLPQVFETVKEFYPSIVRGSKYYNSAVYLMSKNPDEATIDPELEVWDDFNFKGPSDEWNYDPAQIKEENERPYYLLDSSFIYGPEFIFKKKERNDWDSKYLKIEVDAEIPENGGVTITFSGTRNGEIIQYRGENFWMGHDVEVQINSDGEGLGYYALTMPGHLRDSDELKISLWNRAGTSVKIFGYRINLVENIWN